MPAYANYGRLSVIAVVRLVSPATGSSWVSWPTGDRPHLAVNRPLAEGQKPTQNGRLQLSAEFD
jgi:hypothetical protein